MAYTLHISSLTPRRLLSIAMLSICAQAQGETWVITDQAHPVTNTSGIRVILLDEQQRLEEQLTGRLPSDLSKAAASIQAYLSSPEGLHFQRELTQAQQGVVDAWNIGVEKIPAVVIDRRYVVYGESDVHNAVAMIERSEDIQR